MQNCNGENQLDSHLLNDGDMLFVSSSSDHPTYSCILDSACSYHTTLNKDLLDNYMLVNSNSIMIGNDDPCKVVGIENIKIKMFDGVVWTLCDVKHITDLRKNLIILGTLDHKGFNFKFKGEVLKVSKGVMIVMKG